MRVKEGREVGRWGYPSPPSTEPRRFVSSVSLSWEDRWLDVMSFSHSAYLRFS